MTKYVYMFSEGNGSMKNILGGKGANLAEMRSLGDAGSLWIYRYHRGM